MTRLQKILILKLETNRCIIDFHLRSADKRLFVDKITTEEQEEFEYNTSTKSQCIAGKLIDELFDKYIDGGDNYGK